MKEPYVDLQLMETRLVYFTRSQLSNILSDCATVTGGAGAIGLTAIRALLEHGTSGIAIFDLTSSILSSQAAINSLHEDFPNSRIVVYSVDVTDDSSIHIAVEETVASLGSVDILLCFAGIVSCRDAIDLDTAEWRKALDVNTTGSWLCAQAVAKYRLPLISLLTGPTSWLIEK